MIIGKTITPKTRMTQCSYRMDRGERHFLLNKMRGAIFRRIASTVVGIYIVGIHLHRGLKHGIDILNPPVPSMVVKRVMVLSVYERTGYDWGRVKKWP